MPEINGINGSQQAWKTTAPETGKAEQAPSSLKSSKQYNESIFAGYDYTRIDSEQEKTVVDTEPGVNEAIMKDTKKDDITSLLGATFSKKTIE